MGEAASGVEALAKVPLVQPDVVITDIRMEDMDGLEFAEAVRDAYPDTRIIFLSGYDNFAYAQKAVELKAYGYILKPGDPEKVLSIVRDALTEIEGERERVNRLTYLEGRESEGLEARRARLLGRVLSSVYSDGEALEEECAKLEIQTHAMHYCVAVLQPDRFYDLELRRIPATCMRCWRKTEAARKGLYTAGSSTIMSQGHAAWWCCWGRRSQTFMLRIAH